MHVHISNQIFFTFFTFGRFEIFVAVLVVRVLLLSFFVLVVVLVNGFVLFGRLKFYAHRIVCVMLSILKVSFCPSSRLLLFVNDD